MKKLLILASLLAIAAACTKSYDVEPVPQQEISFGSWNDVMTKAPRTGFAANEEFDVFGFKWNDGPDDETNVFNGDDVKYDGTSSWSYSPVRFWDSNFDNYTFFAAFPKDNLAAEAAADDYAQRGLFISNELTYDGSNEVLLVAQKKDVVRANYGAIVPLVFKHTGSLVDIKFKKHTDLDDAVVAVTSIKLSGIKTKGTFTVSGYNGSNDPVGTWAPDATPTVNAASAAAAAAPYVNTSGVSLAADTGTSTATAADLFTSLVTMPQTLGTASGPQITLTYTITTGTGGSAQTNTFTDKVIYFGEFDKTDPDDGVAPEKDNSDPRISSWAPGVHYTYYITINANAIQFSASIAAWDTTDATGHYYLFN